METIFTVLIYLTIKQNSELRLNNMVHPSLWIFHFFIFSLIWYDREWQFISKTYNFTQWASLFLQIFDFKTCVKLRQPVTKYSETTTFWKDPPPSPTPFDQCWWVFKITPRPCCGQISDPQHWCRGRGGSLNGVIFRFFEKKL